MITQPAIDTTPLPRAGGLRIETARLSLGMLEAGDLDGFMQVFGDRGCARMTHAVPHPLSPETAERMLDGMRALPQQHWAIRVDDEALAGVVSLTPSACGKTGGIHNFGPNLSVFVAPEHRGHGYAVEAIDGLLAYVGRRRLHRVVHAAHFADNAASARVLIAADFLYTGRRTMETSQAREGEHPALHMVRIL